jgi:hypothetical protein
MIIKWREKIAVAAHKKLKQEETNKGTYNFIAKNGTS